MRYCKFAASATNLVLLVARFGIAQTAPATTCIPAEMPAVTSFTIGGAAQDGAGNLFVSELGGNRIRKFGPDGATSTIAGNGCPGYSGDGGPAALAQLNVPTALAVDKSGNIYFIDSLNVRVRKISASGIITTIAGNGSPGTAGDGGSATLAQLSLPTTSVGQHAQTSAATITIDSNGNLLVSDSRPNMIRQISVTGTISTQNVPPNARAIQIARPPP